MAKRYGNRQLNVDKSNACKDCGLETTDLYRLPNQPARCPRCHEQNYVHHRRRTITSRSARMYHPDHYAGADGSQQDSVLPLGLTGGQQQDNPENQQHLTPPVD